MSEEFGILVFTWKSYFVHLESTSFNVCYFLAVIFVPMIELVNILLPEIEEYTKVIIIGTACNVV